MLRVLFYICALDFLNSPGTHSILILSNRKTGSSAGEPFTPCPYLESSPWSGSFLVSPGDCSTRALCVWPGLLPGAPLTSRPSVWSQDVSLNQWRFPLEHFSSWRPHHPVSLASSTPCTPAHLPCPHHPVSPASSMSCAPAHLRGRLAILIRPRQLFASDAPLTPFLLLRWPHLKSSRPLRCPRGSQEVQLQLRRHFHVILFCCVFLEVLPGSAS